ncbi:MAG: hypothetical protein HRU13_12560 [Phycisphaerales bacterium]|nr:hypothetical protein [Phycisphaerales bacterium]
MIRAGFQIHLRLWCPRYQEFRPLELISLWKESDFNDHEQIGWEVFWHGDVDSISFDLSGRELEGTRHMNDVFHEVGCVVPADFAENLQNDYDQSGEVVSDFINEITRLRTERFGALR